MGKTVKRTSSGFSNINKLKNYYRQGLLGKAYLEFCVIKNTYGEKWHTIASIEDLLFFAEISLKFMKTTAEFKDIQSYTQKKDSYSPEIECVFDELEYVFLMNNPKTSLKERDLHKHIDYFPNKIAKNYDDKERTARAYCIVGRYYLNVENFEAAKKAFKEAKFITSNWQTRSEIDKYLIITECLIGDKAEVRYLISRYLFMYKYQNNLKIKILKILPLKAVAEVILHR